MSRCKIAISMTIAVACLVAMSDDKIERQERLRNIISVKHYDEERNDHLFWQTELGVAPTPSQDEIARINRDAANGLLDAQCEKGVLTYWGIGVAKDVNKACFIFKFLCAKHKHGRAMKCFSECCYLGAGTACDDCMAFCWWKSSAETGYIPAILSYGDHCWLRCHDGWCKKIKGGCDENSGFCPLKWYKIAAEKGSLIAKLKMACVYASTDGDNHDNGHTNLAKALKILKDLSSSEDVRIRAKANCKIGEIAYNLGDVKKAVFYYDRGDAEGCEQARRNLVNAEANLYGEDMIIQRQFERVKKWNENRGIIRYTQDDVRPIFDESKRPVPRKVWRGFYVGMPVLDAVVLARFYNPQASILLTKDLEVVIESADDSVRSKWLCKCERNFGKIEVVKLNEHPDFVKCLFPGENTDPHGLRSDARSAANAYFEFCMDKKLSKLKQEKIWKERYQGSVIRLKGSVVDVEAGHMVVDGTASITNLSLAIAADHAYNDGGLTESRIKNAKRELDMANGRLKELERKYENDKRLVKNGKIEIEYRGQKKFVTLEEYYRGVGKVYWDNLMPEQAIAKAKREIDACEKKYNALRGIVDVSEIKIMYDVWFEGKATNDRLADLNKGDEVEFEATPSRLLMSRPDGKSLTYTADMRSATLIDGK